MGPTTGSKATPVVAGAVTGAMVFLVVLFVSPGSNLTALIPAVLIGGTKDP